MSDITIGLIIYMLINIPYTLIIMIRKKLDIDSVVILVALMLVLLRGAAAAILVFLLYKFGLKLNYAIYGFLIVNLLAVAYQIHESEE